MFNQDGFFGHALADAGVQSLPPGPLGQDVEAAPGAETAAALGSAGAVGGAVAEASGAGRGLAALDAGRASHAMEGARRVQGTSSSGLPAPISPAVVAPAEPGEGEAIEAGAPRRAFRAVLAAQSPVLVAVREVEQGLRVTARVAGLDETERRQLREAISALLARHGLANARIQIHAMPVRGNER